MRNQSQNSENVNTLQLNSGSWKQKIGALDELALHIKKREVNMAPHLLEPMWL